MDQSIVVLAYECREPLLACLASIQATMPASTEVVVADNGSTDGGPEEVALRFPGVRILPMGGNLGYAAAMNRAVGATRGETVLLLNADVVVPPGGPSRLAAFLEGESKVGIAAPPIVGSDGRPRLTWGRRPGILSEAMRRVLERRVAAGSRLALAFGGGPIRRPRRVDWVSGAAILVRRVAFEAVGGFDEGFFLYFEDVDLCVRMARAGWSSWVIEGPAFRHEGGASARRRPRLAAEAYRRSQFRYFRKHRGAITTAGVRLLVGTRLALATCWPCRGRDADERAYARELAGRVLRGEV